MTEVVSIRFKNGGKTYYFDPGGLKIEAGQKVIAETSRGIEFGECVQENSMVEDRKIVSPLRQIVRIATPEDRKKATENRAKEASAFDICKQKIQEHGLEMKLVDVEYNFENNKILFFFTADGRIDFRELVKELAAIFHLRIELRQIGVRDEAKMIGGLGLCGKPFCCATFLEEFQPVSIKMAKTQNLSLNPTKISGTCGRLMCCLKYEQEAYEDLLTRAPKAESFVETPDGVGTVSMVNLLREQVRVRLESAPDSPRYYKNGDVIVIRSGKGKRPEKYELPTLPEKRLQDVAPSTPVQPGADLLPAEPSGQGRARPAKEGPVQEREPIRKPVKKAEAKRDTGPRRRPEKKAAQEPASSPVAPPTKAIGDGKKKSRRHRNRRRPGSKGPDHAKKSEEQQKTQDK